MKKDFLKITIGIALCLTTFTFFSFVQSSVRVNESNYITVKVLESLNPMSGIKNKIMVIDGKSVIKTIPLEAATIKNEGWGNNAIIINSTFDELKGQGYKLVSSNAPIDGIVTNYIFEK